MTPRALMLGAALLIGLGAGAAAPTPAAAQASATATHLTPPRVAGKRRIMDAARPRARARRGAASAWFWRGVSTRRAAASPGRWAAVVRHVERARRTGKPVFGSTAKARQIWRRWHRLIARQAHKRNVTAPLLIAVIAVESGGDPRAISPKGAGGLMQLMPDTARRFGVANSLAPAQNLRGGARYLDWLLKRYDEDVVLALAAYNAGESVVERHKGVPPYAETRDYVAKVAGAYSLARRLCAKPPRSPRQRCRID